MQARIVAQTHEFLRIEWEEESTGFGQLDLTWDESKGKYELDSELMGIDFIIKIFKALE